MPLPSGLRPWTQHVVDRTEAGSHRIKITPPGGATRDVTYFRGIPTQLSSFAYGDPFGPSTAQIQFPQITALESLGSPHLPWLVAGADVDIDWIDAQSGAVKGHWEGFIVSFEYTADDATSHVTVQCKGALFQVDNFEAYPEYPDRPWPYEIVIKRGLSPKLHPSLRTGELTIRFPQDWKTVVPDMKKEPTYMRPFGVKTGQKWTGLTTRTTGSWNKMLTGQIQSLLSLLFTPDGSQWTIGLNPGRKPHMYVRQIKYEADDTTMLVNVGQPGVKVSLTEDWTEAANVYYGSGTDIGGTQYSNAVISTDGSRTSYTPFAALRQVHPENAKSNQWYEPTHMRNETFVQFDNGLSPQQATNLALSQLQRSAHPGYTGNVGLAVDPEVNGKTLSRFLIKPGRTLLLRGFKGMPSGLLVHVAEVTVNVQDGTVDLTVDSKFRDLLTISQVRARTRDALTTLRALRVGSFAPIIQDLRKPWSYAEGSGMIPNSPKGPSAKRLFNKLGTANEVFPWTDLTRRYPPKSHPHFYIRIPPASHNWNYNWASESHGKIGVTARYALPTYFGETATIRLTQIAAYDQHGRVMPIRFHVGIYTVQVSVATMPQVPGPDMPGYLPQYAQHKGQHYPFFPGAFEATNPDGSPKGPGDLSNKQQSMVVGWGNYYQGAGYYPGLQTGGGHPTGLLVDETTWNFDVTSSPNFNQRPTKSMPQGKSAGLLYIMIYAESSIPKEGVFFLGRCFRQEPGTT